MCFFLFFFHFEQVLHNYCLGKVKVFVFRMIKVGASR